MKTFAVLIDGSPNDATSLQSAVAIARHFGGKLTVMHPNRSQIFVPAGMHGDVAWIDNTEEMREATKEAHAAFEKVAANAPGARLIELDLGAGEALGEIALYHDLVMLERVDDGEGPDSILLSAALWDGGIPVLVLPPKPMGDKLDTVVLAWNRTPAAANAMRAALPMIQAAKKLVIFSREGAASHDAELKAYLEAEGVTQIEWKSYGKEGQNARAWGRDLLAACKSEAADLLVMGAFGSSLSNWLGFGRATQKICSDADLPVLLHA
jgi:nucleotide-binding universal stress UspA family protein